METPLPPEHELSKHEETAQEAIPPTQREEAPSPPKSGTVNENKILKDEMAEARDKYLRLYAEFENHRRRTAKERWELIQTANEQLLKSLLPVADDFDRAEKSFRDKDEKESEGFFLIRNKFKTLLEQYGVKEMATANDTDFNPDLHDAITQLETQDEKKKGKILEVVERGYLLNEKVIRHAKVVVGS